MRRLLLSLGAVSLLAACGGGDDGTTPPNPPSITLTASASTGIIARGASSTAILTLGRVNGYGGNVSFTAEGAPTGVTVVFTPQVLSGAATQTTATISVASTAAPGSANLTFRATGSGVTDQTVTYALSIPTPAITVSVGAGTATAAQGGTATVGVTITRANGFTGAVNLTAEGLPANVTAAFAPASIPDGSTTSTLTLTVGANATVSTSPIIVRAASAGVTDQTATVQLTVTAAGTPAYSITAAPAALSLTAGQPGTSTLTITKTGGFAGNVTLGLEGAPAGVAGTFTPNPATGTTSTLSLTTTAATVPGVYNLTVRGAAAGLSDRTITIALTVAGPPAVTVALLPTTLSIAQGGNAQSTLTLARVGGLTGDVALTSSGAPAGMTVAFAPSTVLAAANSSTVTVSVGGAVAAGTYNIAITATAPGNVVGTATLPVTVTVASGFSLTATNVTLAQNSSTASTITITRLGGYVGAVTLNATNVPPNIVAEFSPNPATGGTSTLTITASVGAVVGNYTITVNGQGPGAANQTTTLSVSVTASGGGGGNVAWRFCDPTRVPLWFAFRNGSSGAWTQVTASANNTFSFNLTGSLGSVAMVIPRAGGGTDGYVYLNTATELQGIAAGECTNSQGTPTKSLTGTVAGVALLQLAGVSVGGASASINGPATTYSLTNVPDRVTDLLAARSAINTTTFALTPDRGVVRRNVNYPANSAIPLIDFGGAEWFAFITATATIANAGTDQVSAIQIFQTGNGASAPLSIGAPTGGTVTMYGVPTSQSQAGDLHAFTVGATNAGLTSVRSFVQYNRDVANRTYTLGSELTLPTVTTTATAPYARLKAAGSWQAEYPDAGGSSMTQGTRAWTIQGSRGFFGTGAATYEFELPDFTGTTGFQNTWGLVTGSPVSVNTNFFAYLVGSGGVINDGTQFKYAARVQTQTP